MGLAVAGLSVTGLAAARIAELLLAGELVGATLTGAALTGAALVGGELVTEGRRIIGDDDGVVGADARVLLEFTDAAWPVLGRGTIGLSNGLKGLEVPETMGIKSSA